MWLQRFSLVWGTYTRMCRINGATKSHLPSCPVTLGPGAMKSEKCNKPNGDPEQKPRVVWVTALVWEICPGIYTSWNREFDWARWPPSKWSASTGKWFMPTLPIAFSLPDSRAVPGPIVSDEVIRIMPLISLGKSTATDADGACSSSFYWRAPQPGMRGDFMNEPPQPVQYNYFQGVFF